MIGRSLGRGHHGPGTRGPPPFVLFDDDDDDDDDGDDDDDDDGCFLVFVLSDHTYIYKSF